MKLHAPPVLNMTSPGNLLPSHRPPRPSFNRGPVQMRAKRAFRSSDKQVLGTPEIARWTHPRRTSRRNAYIYLRKLLPRYCEKVGRGAGVGRPILWNLK
jgi:hypothetical protein